MWEDTKQAFSNCDYVLCFFIFCSIWGTYTIFAVILNPFLGPLFTPSQLAIIGVVYILSGLVGSIIVGFYIDKTYNFKFAIRFIAFGNTLCFAVGIWVVTTKNFIVMTITSIPLGLTTVPILPSVFQFTALISQPIPPAIVNGNMMMTAQLYGFFASLGVSPLCSRGQWPVMLFFTACSSIAAILSIFLKKGSPQDRLK